MRLGGVTLGPPEGPGRGSARRPSATRAVLTLLVLPAALAGVLLAAMHVDRQPARLVGQVPAVPPAPATVTLSVAGTTLRAGRPLAATVAVVNHTDRALRGGCPGHGWPVLLLSGAGLSGAGWSDLMPCPPALMPPGLSRVRVTVPTTYRQCSQAGATGRPDIPACAPGPAMPPLPAGTYQLNVGPAGLPAGTSLPSPVTITLTG